MSGPPFTVQPLGIQDRSAFTCGVEALDRYLHSQVGQDVRRRVTACYVAVETATGEIAGYYTLSASEVLLADMPAELARKLPRYPGLPVARLGRLAVARKHQGHKLGAALLLDAAARATRSEIAVFALVVDAKDDQAVAFYRHHGFQPFGPTDRQLVAPIATFKEILI
ncbi:GNAT family N-acetyltransferase [Methylobacterium sp. NEAU 140]|uniref:GNAT family N-acetyltransferase n=1 Tax=Methylobacterium sp. NEAU 140 TaxID=3064945 RepID=UPI002736D46F|nr:GNAT family N-acetyltransferase [Methylobacterium sp. NEAU 140]MDP4026610.1 GNAT family N-acetyltransferase [Methylobacterium sp. NEAU 140]